MADLLDEFQNGYSLDRLSDLLKAAEPQAVRAGMWIASELGVGARPLIGQIAGLLHSPVAAVRFLALECLLACAEPSDASAVTQALSLVEDSESSVRWQMLMFLANVPRPVLEAARQVCADEMVDLLHIKGLDLLLHGHSHQATIAIYEGLKSRHRVTSAYAAAGAARIVRYDSGPLRIALESQDAIIRRFAADVIERLRVEDADTD